MKMIEVHTISVTTPTNIREKRIVKMVPGKPLSSCIPIAVFVILAAKPP